MQKLVTIFLAGYDQHGKVEEHLADHLSEGWRIVSISIAAGSAQHLSGVGWLAVLLERG